MYLEAAATGDDLGIFRGALLQSLRKTPLRDSFCGMVKALLASRDLSMVCCFKVHDLSERNRTGWRWWNNHEEAVVTGSVLLVGESRRWNGHKVLSFVEQQNPSALEFKLGTGERANRGSGTANPPKTP